MLNLYLNHDLCFDSLDKDKDKDRDQDILSHLNGFI